MIKETTRWPSLIRLEATTSNKKLLVASMIFKTMSNLTRNFWNASMWKSIVELDFQGVGIGRPPRSYGV